jgi:hypothetical protein
MNKKNIGYIIIILIIILLYFLLKLKEIEPFENINLIIQSSPSSGFFSNFNKLITYLVDNPTTTKITYDMRSHGPSSAFSYIKENEELFSKLFDIYDEGLETTKSIVSSEYQSSRITGVEAYNFYNENRNKLQPFHDAYNKYIKIKSNIQNKINKKVNELKTNTDQIIGIFIRSNALAGEQPSKRMPTREEYVNAINNIRKSNNVKYFFCIDNQEDLEYFKQLYTPNYFTDIRRTQNTNDGEPHTKTMGTLEDLENSFIEVCIMSQCNILVHCVSNMVTASLYMNMNQESVCVSG